MYNIITISREYGSGGRLVGELAAKELGWDFYDRNLIDMAALKSGLSTDYIAEREERSGGSFSWEPYLPQGAAFITGAAVMNYYSNEDRMFEAQSSVIREVAEKGPCVIVGRCADYVLRDRTDCLRAFVYADLAQRVKRVVDVYHADARSAQSQVKATDKGRAAYYKHYTDLSWRDYRNYHLALDSGFFGVERCVDLIVRAARGE